MLDGVPPDTRVVIAGVTWEFYDRFSRAVREGDNCRVAFDGNDIEMMTLGPLHERYKTRLDIFVAIVADELAIEFQPQGSTTWKRKRVKRGVEPDSCFYFKAEKLLACAAAEEKGSNKVEDYPNPDLAIEVDLSPSKIDRPGIYAALQVGELWQHPRQGRINRAARLPRSIRRSGAKPVPASPARGRHAAGIRRILTRSDHVEAAVARVGSDRPRLARENIKSTITQQPPHPASADPGHTVLEMRKIEIYAEPSPDGYASRVDYAAGEHVSRRRWRDDRDSRGCRYTFLSYPQPSHSRVVLDFAARPTVHGTKPRDVRDRRSGQDLSDDSTVNVGQAAVDAVVAKCQSRVVDAEEMKHRGMEVVAIGWVLGRLVRPLVAGTVNDAPFDSAAGQPGGERKRIVVAALAPLAAGHAAKLGGPDHDGVVEQAAGLQVLEQRGRRLIHAPAHLAVIAGDVFVRIPVAAGKAIVGAAPDLDESHTPLQQASGDQAVAAEVGCRRGRQGRRGPWSRATRRKGRVPRVHSIEAGPPARTTRSAHPIECRPRVRPCAAG